MTCFLFPDQSWPPSGAARFPGWVARPAGEGPVLRSFPRIPRARKEEAAPGSHVGTDFLGRAGLGACFWVQDRDSHFPPPAPCLAHSEGLTFSR